MSLRGIFAIIFEACLLIMALGTEIRDFLIVAVCIGGLLLFSLLSVLFASLTLRYKVIAEDREFSRQDSMNLSLNISGICILPVICKVMLFPPFYEANKTATALSNSFIVHLLKCDRNYAFNLKCINTGHWTVGIKHINISDIFGFFNYSFIFSRTQNRVKVTVLPKLHIIPENSDDIYTENEYMGASLRNSELGEVLSDSREYIAGDPLRRINWKQSARTGKLFTRMFERAEEPKAVIAIDCLAVDDTGTTQDICRETALFLAQYFISIGFSVKILALRGQDALTEAEFRELKEYDELRQHLTNITFKPKNTPLLPTDIDSGDYFDSDRVFIISANPDDLLLDYSFTVKFGIDTQIIVAGKNRQPIIQEEKDDSENTHFTYIEIPENIPLKAGELL